jgi:hypothetical protein
MDMLAWVERQIELLPANEQKLNFCNQLALCKSDEPNWIISKDTNTGKRYYYHKISRQSKWRTPLQTAVGQFKHYFLKQCTVPQLKELCKAAKLAVSGLKDALCFRLMEHDVARNYGTAGTGERLQQQGVQQHSQTAKVAASVPKADKGEASSTPTSPRPCSGPMSIQKKSQNRTQFPNQHAGQAVSSQPRNSAGIGGGSGGNTAEIFQKGDLSRLQGQINTFKKMSSKHEGCLQNLGMNTSSTSSAGSTGGGAKAPQPGNPHPCSGQMAIQKKRKRSENSQISGGDYSIYMEVERMLKMAGEQRISVSKLRTHRSVAALLDASEDADNVEDNVSTKCQQERGRRQPLGGWENAILSACRPNTESSNSAKRKHTSDGLKFQTSTYDSMGRTRGDIKSYGRKDGKPQKTPTGHLKGELYDADPFMGGGGGERERERGASKLKKNDQKGVSKIRCRGCILGEPFDL